MSSSNYVALPPGGGHAVRTRLLTFAMICITPLGLIIVGSGVFARGVGVPTAPYAWVYSVGALATSVVVMQITTLICTSASIKGDMVRLGRASMAKRTMTYLSFPIVATAPLLGVYGIFVGVGVGILNAIGLFGIGVLGLLARHLLEKLERLAAVGADNADSRRRRTQ